MSELQFRLFFRADDNHHSTTFEFWQLLRFPIFFNSFCKFEKYKFTLIFVTMLAFKDPSYINEAKLMILLASVSAALLGFFYLKIVLGKGLKVVE